MLKTAFALLVCGIVLASASPRCSEDVIEKCNPLHEQIIENVETDEQLDHNCRYSKTITQCEVEFYERCPSTQNNMKLKYGRALQEVYEQFCDKSNPLRQKFLDNTRCLSQFTSEVFTTCVTEEVSGRYNEESRCDDLKRIIRCAEQKIGEKCGEDARQVFIVGLNEDFQLSLADCL